MQWLPWPILSLLALAVLPVAEASSLVPEIDGLAGTPGPDGPTLPVPAQPDPPGPGAAADPQEHPVPVAHAPSVGAENTPDFANPSDTVTGPLSKLVLLPVSLDRDSHPLVKASTPLLPANATEGPEEPLLAPATDRRDEAAAQPWPQERQPNFDAPPAPQSSLGALKPPAPEARDPAAPAPASVGPPAPGSSMRPGTLVAVAGGFALASLLALARWLAPASLLTRGDVAAHPLRARIQRLLDHQPGATVQDLCYATGMGRGALRYHLTQMELHGMLRSALFGRTRHYYRARAHGPSETSLAALAALSQARNSFAAAVIRDNPGCIQRQVARALGMGPSQAHNCLHLLEEVGLVQSRREGRVVRYYPSQLLLALEGGTRPTPR